MTVKSLTYKNVHMFACELACLSNDELLDVYEYVVTSVSNRVIYSLVCKEMDKRNYSTVY